MNLVVIQNRQAVTSSLQVAESFDKQHKDVLESINNLMKGVAENSAYSNSPIFFESTYQHPQNKQKYPLYYMNRDGFTLLAMGFTGQKAIQFKLAYIQAFNEMERQLTQPTQAELIAMMAQHNVEQERRLNAVEERATRLEAHQESIAQIVSLNPSEWRDKVNVILNRIAMARGGGEQFRLVRNESYELLEMRARCKLDIRLNNRKKEALANGIVPRAKIDKFSKIDVIAEDTRLTEIYLAIVKEMAIKHSVNAEGLGA